MENSAKMFSQVAAAAGVTDQQAMVACYLLNLARAGKQLDEAAALLRMSRPEVRDHARSWAIPFTDYTANTAPLKLTWIKAKRGLWELHHDGRVVAVAQSDGSGGYTAAITGRPRDHWDGSAAYAAIGRASHALERDSVERLGVDDVVILGPRADREIDQLAPKDIGDRASLARVLHS